MSASSRPGEPCVRVAVIGAGHCGANLIRLFDADPAAEVVAVAEPDSTRRARVAARLPRARTTGDAHVALAAPNVDTVVVATPTSTHTALVRAALEHGKHLQGAFADLVHGPGDFPETEAGPRQNLSLPIFPEITEAQQDRVCERLLAALLR